MKPFAWRFSIFGIGMLLCVFCMLFPHPSRALKPLDDQALLQYSPATVDQAATSRQIREKPIPPAAIFNQSVCFKRCHSRTDFSCADKTVRQWQLLIRDNGHAIFQTIDWPDPETKRRVLDYLLEHAKDADANAEGIGVWN